MTAQIIYSTLEAWRPRHYYIMKNKTSGKRYVGQTTQNIETYLGSGPYWVNHCKSNGGYTRENIEITWYELFICETSAKNWLQLFENENPNYYLKENEEWANDVPENTSNSPFVGVPSELHPGSLTSKRRVREGTHHWLGDSNPQVIASQNGTHHWSGENNPAHERMKNGTHNWLISNKERLEDGTHNWLGGDYQKDLAAKRLEDGTHNFQTNHPQKQKWKCLETGKISTKTGFTTWARNRGFEVYPHKLVKWG